MKYIYLNTTLRFPLKSKMLLFAVGLLLSMYTHAQITVGEEVAPKDFSVLEVSAKNVQGGLRLPRMSTADRDLLSQKQSFLGEKEALAVGLTIYNTTINCIEYWDGTSWVSMCEQAEEVETENPEGIPTGAGVFSGKTCFDVVAINDGPNGGGPVGCALLDDRAGHKVYFTNRTPQDPNNGNPQPDDYTGVQVYTFTPSGAVSKVRFEYIDESGIVIQSMTPNGDYSGNNIATPCKVTVAFYASLENDLKGLTSATALKANLFVIYNDQANGRGVDRKLRITLSFQDCICCGAKTIDGGWLNFMCHNLGADTNTYPLNSTNQLLSTMGWLYQWGRPTDGHQLRSSATTPTLATNNSATQPSIVEGRFIQSSTPPFDWRSGGGNNARWGNGTSVANPPKATNDPCPAGWKIPSKAQWESIGPPANPWFWDVDPVNPGYVIGDMLYLPPGGFRDFEGIESGVGDVGYYWSSTATATESYALVFEYDNTTDEKIIETSSPNARVIGFSVRCVEE